MIFFASDNGAHLEGGHDYHFFNSTGGLTGHKRSLYEGGMRSPVSYLPCRIQLTPEHFPRSCLLYPIVRFER